MNFKIMKSIAAASLAALMLISAVGCDDKNSSSKAPTSGKDSVGSMAAKETVAATGSESGNAESVYTYSDNWARNYSKFTNLEEYTSETHLNAKEVYEKLSYTPQTFFGEYVNENVIDGDKSIVNLNAEAATEAAKMYGTTTIANDKGEEYEISTVPYYFKAGPRSYYKGTPLEKINKYNRMSMSFFTSKDDGSYAKMDIAGVYYIEGHKLIFTPFSKYELDEAKENVADYKLSDKNLEYDFEFTGGQVTLKNGNDSVTLTAVGLSEKITNELMWTYSSSTARVDDIVGFYITRNKGNEYIEKVGDNWSKISNYIQVYTLREDGYTDEYENVVGHFNEDGILNFSWAESNGTPHAYEFVYFFCGSDGLILTDGTTKYYYTGSYSDYQLGTGTITSDDEALEKLDEGKIAAIAEKKKSLQDELMKAFEKEGINVECNEETGEIMLDSSILFDVGKYELSSSGEEFLNKFMKAYSSVILKDDYEGFVSKIMVEGHTDSTGERKQNEELSKNRADEVLNYCVSDKTKIDSKVRENMKSLMEAVGYADDYPIFDEGGKEDQEKSRRVSFRFIIDMENASQLEAPEKIDEEAQAQKAAEVVAD